MKKLILLLLVLSGCASYNSKVKQSLIINTTGVVISVDKKDQIFEVYWECTNAPFKRQPCARISVHAISDYENVKLGDSFKIVKQ
jgi:hypothetical protein